MINKFNILISSFVITLTLVAPQLSYGSQERKDEDISYAQSPFRSLPLELRWRIVAEAAVGQALSKNLLTDLALVNREWLSIVKGETQIKKPVWKILHGVTTPADEKEYQMFLNGKLYYRPTYYSDVGMIELAISAFPNPLKGTFDLSQCGPRGDGMKITTSLSDFFQYNTNDSTLNILFAPYFLFKRYLTSSAKPFKKILNNWDRSKAPIGIFRRLGGGNLTPLNYLVSSSAEVISSKNLYENALDSHKGPGITCFKELHFTFICEPKVDDLERKVDNLERKRVKKFYFLGSLVDDGLSIDSLINDFFSIDSLSDDICSIDSLSDDILLRILSYKEIAKCVGGVCKRLERLRSDSRLPLFSKIQDRQQLQSYTQNIHPYKLKKLIINFRLDDPVFKINILQIGNFTHLTELDLSHTISSYNSMSFLAPEIGKLTNLTVLGFSENNLGDGKNLQIFAPEIGKLTQLKKLALNKNNIGSKTHKDKCKEFGVKPIIKCNSALAQAVGQLQQLRTLELEENDMDLEDLNTFASEIDKLPQLRKLRINKNKFGIAAETSNKFPRLKSFIMDTKQQCRDIPLGDYHQIFLPLDTSSSQHPYMCATEASLRSLMATLTESSLYFDRKSVKFSEVLSQFFQNGYVVDGFCKEWKGPNMFRVSDLYLISKIIEDEINDGIRHVHYHGQNCTEAFMEDIITEFRSQVYGKPLPNLTKINEIFLRNNGVLSLGDLFKRMENKATKLHSHTPSRGKGLAERVRAYSLSDKKNRNYIIATNFSLFGGNGARLEYSLRYFFENRADDFNQVISGKYNKWLDFKLSYHLDSTLEPFLISLGLKNIKEKISQYEKLFQQTFFPTQKLLKGGRLLVFSIKPEIADQVSYVTNCHLPLEYDSPIHGNVKGKPSVIIDELRKTPQAFEERCGERIGIDTVSRRTSNAKDNPKSIDMQSKIFPNPVVIAENPDNFQSRSYDLWWRNPNQKEKYHQAIGRLVKLHIAEIISLPLPTKMRHLTKGN